LGLVVDTDLKAVFRLSRAVIRGMMKARYGRIINVTSVVGHAGNPGRPTTAPPRPGSAA
jgi:3-oxoacyl-[acyl-carrier protein] reductase